MFVFTEEQNLMLKAVGIFKEKACQKFIEQMDRETDSQ